MKNRVALLLIGLALVGCVPSWNPFYTEKGLVFDPTLRRTVPAAVPGLVFLSGGQSDVCATEHLDALDQRGPTPSN